MTRPTRSCSRSRSLWILGAAALLACGATASSGERRLAAFADADAFAMRWDAGRLEPRRDAARRWLHAELPGTGATALVANAEPYDPPIDFTGRFLRVEVRVEDMRALQGMAFRLSSDGLGEDYFEFTVPLYADEHANVLQSGDWVTWTFSFGAAARVGDPDRAAIDSIGWLLVEKAGAEAPALEADWAEVAAVAEPPRGVVSFTFDDGYDEHARVAAPLMAERGFRGTAYVMPAQIGEQGYMTLDELRALRDDFGWDVGAHHHLPFTDVAPEELNLRMRDIRESLARYGFGATAGHLAYPLGKQEPRIVLPLARRHFATARVAGSGPETLPPGDPHRLRVYNVVATTTPEELREAARRAAEHREWLILMFHYLVDEPEWATHYRIADFERALDAIAGEDVDVRTVAEVWSAVPAARP